MDPRLAAVDRRLAGISRLIGVTGSKGGIGKSVVSSALALGFADRGLETGLFDLDFTSPTDHLILGADRRFPEEDFGIDPHRVEEIAIMSVAFFSGDAPAPLRGADATSALLELLAITRWGDLDVLVLDLPPGLGDTALDIIRLIPRVEFLVVGTASAIVVGSVRRALRLLTELDVPMAGVVENLRRDGGSAVEDLAASFGARFLGAIPYDPSLEEALGDAARLRATEAFSAISTVGALLCDAGGECR